LNKFFANSERIPANKLDVLVRVRISSDAFYTNTKMSTQKQAPVGFESSGKLFGSSGRASSLTGVSHFLEKNSI
jgi:hypothetical protein